MRRCNKLYRIRLGLALSMRFAFVHIDEVNSSVSLPKRQNRLWFLRHRWKQLAGVSDEENWPFMIPSASIKSTNIGWPTTPRLWLNSHYLILTLNIMWTQHLLTWIIYWITQLQSQQQKTNNIRLKNLSNLAWLRARINLNIDLV